MAVNIEQLRNFTRELGFGFEEGDFDGQPALAIDVPTEMSNGMENVTIAVRSYDDGQMFEAVVIGLIPTELHQKSEHKMQFLFYLLHKAWQTKFGTPEVDKDGEVRLVVEVPLVDALMTLKQFEHILRAAAVTTVQIAVEGSQILKHGKMPESVSGEGDDPLRQMMASMLEMVGSAEGRGQLKQIADDEDYPEGVRQIARKFLESASQAPDSL